MQTVFSFSILMLIRGDKRNLRLLIFEKQNNNATNDIYEKATFYKFRLSKNYDEPVQKFQV